MLELLPSEAVVPVFSSLRFQAKSGGESQLLGEKEGGCFSGATVRLERPTAVIGAR